MHICIQVKNQEIPNNTVARYCQDWLETFWVWSGGDGMLIFGYPCVWRPVVYLGCSSGVIPLTETGSFWDRTSQVGLESDARQAPWVHLSMLPQGQKCKHATLCPAFSDGFWDCVHTPTPILVPKHFTNWGMSPAVIYMLDRIAMWARLTGCGPPASTSQCWMISVSLCQPEINFESTLLTTGNMWIPPKMKDSSHYCV